MVSGITRKAMIEIADYVLKAVELINDEEKERMIEELLKTKKEGRKIFVMGAGRSGLVAKAFAMRLLHLGFDVYVIGETILPPVSRGDLVIAVSGSGRTRTVVAVAEAAKSVGAKVIAVTTFSDSPLGKISDMIVRIPGRTKIATEEDYLLRQIYGIHEPLAPLGTLFEVTTLVFLDGIISELMYKLGVSEEELRERHANVE